VMDFEPAVNLAAPPAAPKAPITEVEPSIPEAEPVEPFVPEAQTSSNDEPAPSAKVSSLPTLSIDDWFVRAEQAERKGLTAQAEAAYRQVLALHPAHEHAAINLSALLSEQDRHRESVAVCELASRHGVEHALLHFNHGIALESLNTPRAALAAYKRALALHPALADAHYNTACLLEKLDDSRGALRHFAAYRRLTK
jgi:tetratricopeptide (TPR) repeat protein